MTDGYCVENEYVLVWSFLDASLGVSSYAVSTLSTDGRVIRADKTVDALPRGLVRLCCLGSRWPHPRRFSLHLPVRCLRLDPTNLGATIAVAPGQMPSNFLPSPTQIACLLSEANTMDRLGRGVFLGSEQGETNCLIRTKGNKCRCSSRCCHDRRRLNVRL